MFLPKPLTSLVVKLALIYLGLALVAAVSLRAVTLTGELSALDRELHAGWLASASTREAAKLGARWSEASLGADVDTLLRELRTPGDPNEGPADVLSEFPDSLSAAVLDMHGRVLAHRGPAVSWPTPRTVAGGAARRQPSDPSAWIYLTPIRSPAGAQLGYLGVKLQMQPPGWRALFGDAFEAPALIVYGLVFAFGSALVLNLLVTRRLKRFELGAEAWGRGDFGPRTADGSLDEIGRLGRRLDVMAADLKSLVALRARIAGLSERERLAVELHDTVKQKAFALQLQLAALRPDAKHAAAVEECRRITSEIQAELAALIEPAIAGGRIEAATKSFAAEIQERADTWARRGGFEVTTRLPAAAAIPLEDQPIVLRVLDEALANVMRHSGADAATVEVLRRAGSFELRVCDNGRGLGRTVDGVGLGAMRKRAQELPKGRVILTDGAPGARLSLKWSRERESAQ